MEQKSLNRVRRTSIFEADAGSKTAILVIWVIACAALIVSLWLVADGGEPGAIYLRAAGILYLGLTISLENVVARSVRVAGGSVMLILCVSAVTLKVANIPLYIATGLIIVHIVLSILTFPGGPMYSISGLRGLAFMSVAAVVSVICVLVSIMSETTISPIDVGRCIVFAVVGACILAMANGIPVKEKDQVIGCFSVLAPASAAMYCLGSLERWAAWLIAGAALGGALAALLVCITANESWQRVMARMWHFAVSSKTTALVLLLVFTFGNIACVNGTSDGDEAKLCASSSALGVGFDIEDVAASGAYSMAEIEYMNGISRGMRASLCLSESLHSRALKLTEEMIPLLLMGLAKGALVVLVILPVSSDLAETSAWATATVLSLSAVLLLGIEGRGRCFLEDTSTCNVNRSGGFITGLVLSSAAALTCLVRALYAGVWIPRKNEMVRREIAKAIEGSEPETMSASKRLRNMVMSGLSRREIGTAVAVAALLVCLISTSTAEVSVSGSPWTEEKSDFLMHFETPSSLGNTSWGAATDGLRCPFNDTLCNKDAVFLGQKKVKEVLEARATSLEAYWQTTSLIVAGAVAAMCILAVETMPKSPAVGISIMAALLLAAGRIHYACLISSLNRRMLLLGVSFDVSVELNVYIISTISIVVGLAWADSVMQGAIPKEVRVRAESAGQMLLVLDVSSDDDCRQTYEEAYSVLVESKMINAFLVAKLIGTTAKTLDTTNSRNSTWIVQGQGNLKDGRYLMGLNSRDMMEIAQTCNSDRGCISLLTKGPGSAGDSMADQKGKALSEVKEDEETA